MWQKGRDKANFGGGVNHTDDLRGKSYRQFEA